MTALFEEVFNNPNCIYETFFFNVKAVLSYPTLTELEKQNKPLFESWKYLSKTKYNFDLNDEHQMTDKLPKSGVEFAQKIYEKNAVYHPEFNRIVAISYATLSPENGELKRHFKKIANDDEYIVITTFMEILHVLSSDGVNSTPQYFPPLCGHSIIAYDIPLLLRRFIFYRDEFKTNKIKIPYILKRAVSIKPWESGLIDVANVWKFNGFDIVPLTLISNYLGLKTTTELLPLDELSKYYWANIETKPKETLDFIGLQSVTQTNLVIQLMNEIRQL